MGLQNDQTNLQLFMQKVRQYDLNFSENPIFDFEMLRFFYVNVSSNFVLQEWVDALSEKRFSKDIYSFL